MPRVPNSGELLAWSSIQQALSCKESSSQKKMYGLTSENDVAHPAGDLRTPNERNIQFSQCGWTRGHFLGSSGDELADTPRKRQEVLSEPKGESGHGRSPNETSDEGVAEVRDVSLDHQRNHSG